MHVSRGGGGKSYQRDTFLSPFIAGSPAHYRGSSSQEAGGFVEAFADTELIPNFTVSLQSFPAP